MGYPRKSYPHRCPPACAKRSRPRACARVYINIVRPSAAPGECPRRSGKESTPLWHRVPRRRAQGGGGRRQRRTPPRAVPNMPLVCRITVCKGGVHQANPAPARALSPRQLVYGRVPARLCAESLCAKAEVHKAIPAPARAFSPRQLVYGHAPARLCVESLCAKAEVHKANPAPARALSPRQLVYGRAPAR